MKPDPQNPLVSIITPSYNQAEFIETNILSISRQQYPNIEHIVVDGGSSDATLHILKKHENTYNLRWVSEPDNGQAHAINKGFDMAGGDILAYLNSDDSYINSKVIGSVVDCFKANANIDMVYGSYNITNSEGAVLRHIKPPLFSFRLLLKSGFIPQPTVFLRRTVLSKTGLLDESLHYGMDLDLWFRVHKTNAEIRRLDLDIANFRLHSQSKTVSQTAKMIREGYLIVRPRYSANMLRIRYYYLRVLLVMYLKRFLKACYGKSSSISS